MFAEYTILGSMQHSDYRDAYTINILSHCVTFLFLIITVFQHRATYLLDTTRVIVNTFVCTVKQSLGLPLRMFSHPNDSPVYSKSSK